MIGKLLYYINGNLGKYIFKNPNTLYYNLFNKLHRVLIANKELESEEINQYLKNGFFKTKINSVDFCKYVSAAMQKLNTMNLLETIRNVTENKKKFILGICLGMQLFFEKSFEFEESSGLKILKGNIKTLNTQKNRKDIKLPNIGWKNLIINKNNKNSIT